MRFLVDQNLPVVLVGWLIQNGHEAEHVRLLGMAEADDREILAKARVDQAVIISKDGDFARRQGAAPPIQVIWVRIGNTTNDALLAVWSAVWPGVAEALAAGEDVIEVGRRPQEI